MMLDIDFSGVCGRLKLALLGQILNKHHVQVKLITVQQHDFDDLNFT